MEFKGMLDLGSHWELLKLLRKHKHRFNQAKGWLKVNRKT